jgi:hypothetical protein
MKLSEAISVLSEMMVKHGDTDVTMGQLQHETSLLVLIAVGGNGASYSADSGSAKDDFSSSARSQASQATAE